MKLLESKRGEGQGVMVVERIFFIFNNTQLSSTASLNILS
jgi:hypothetical protein